MIVLMLVTAAAAFALTCYDIQYTTVPGTGNTYPSPYEGQTVSVTGIVTNNTYGTTSTSSNTRFFISDLQGGPWSGLYVYRYGKHLCK